MFAIRPAKRKRPGVGNTGFNPVARQKGIPAYNPSGEADLAVLREPVLDKMR